MGKAKPVSDPRPELPRAAQVGDRVRLKDDLVVAYVEACEAAGWSFNPATIRTITRQDNAIPGGGRRLFFDGPPFCFGERDVVLAWNTEDERREALRREGWRV